MRLVQMVLVSSEGARMSQVMLHIRQAAMRMLARQAIDHSVEAGVGGAVVGLLMAAVPTLQPLFR